MQTALFTKTFDDRSLEDAIETAVEIGYDGVEIMAREPHFPSDIDTEHVEGIRELLDDYGMGMPCLATYTGGYARKTDAECEAELETLEAFLERAEVLDVDLLRHGAGRPSIREADQDDIERAVTWLRRAADLAAEYNKTLGLEIHSHRLTETAAATMDLIERVDRENIEVIHDAGNMFIADDPFGAESVEAIGDRLAHVHVKDLSRIDDPDQADAFTLETGRGEEVFRREFLGEGDVDHAPLFEALVEREYDGYVTDESTVRRIDRETVARRELEALEGLLAG